MRTDDTRTDIVSALARLTLRWKFEVRLGRLWRSSCVKKLFVSDFSEVVRVFKSIIESNAMKPCSFSFPNLIAGCLFVATMFCSDRLFAAEQAAIFKISDKVIVKSPPRFGVNMFYNGHSHWQGSVTRNQWVPNPSFEPTMFRHQGFATGGSAGTLINTDNGISYYNSFLSGWWDGADVLIYRLEDGKVRLLRTDKVKRSVCGKGTEETLYLEEDGPAIKAGDLYQLYVEHTDIPATRQESHRRFTMDAEPRGAPVEMACDDSTFAPTGGRSSLKVTLGRFERAVGIRRWWLHRIDEKRLAWTRVPADAPTFKGSFWMKSDGLANSTIELRIGDWSKQFKVTKDWKEYTYEFKLVEPKKLTVVGFFAQGPGTFWLDNWVMYDSRRPISSLDPQMLQALKDYRPGHLRFWTGANQGKTGGNSLDNYLAGIFERAGHFNWDRARLNPQQTSLQEDLQLCREVGADPWIIVDPTYTADEHRDLLEYLGGPTTTQYGKLRARHGQADAWTDSFDEIIIEIGNEQWNQIFQPLAFAWKGEFFGAFSDNMFHEAQQSPYYDKNKIRYMVGGWAINVGKWNDKVISRAAGADQMCIATYTGGGFDTEDLIATGSDETFMQRLYYIPRVVQPKMDSFTALATKFNKKPAIYESGPGYDLPAPGKGFDPKDELIGKSIAQAVTTIDGFMYGQSHGYGAQCFFGFRPGRRWASHSFMNDFRPHSAWLALQMRNRYCAGDLVEVAAVDVPKVDLPEVLTAKKTNSGKVKIRTMPAVHDVPTVMAYAYRDEARWSVLLFSRRLNGTVDIKLEFPFQPKQNGALYTLTADQPHAGNIRETEVEIEERTLEDVSAEYSLRLPPFSLAVLQVEQSSAAATPE